MGDILNLQTLKYTSAASGAVASGVAGFGQYQGGQAQKAAYDYNANLAIVHMEEAEEQLEQQYSKLISRQASLYAKAGVDIQSGSPLMVMAATAAKGGVEAERIREAGTEEWSLDKYYAKVAAWSGEMGGISTFLSGLSAVGRGLAGAQGPGTTPTAPLSSAPYFGGAMG